MALRLLLLTEEFTDAGAELRRVPVMLVGRLFKLLWRLVLLTEAVTAAALLLTPTVLGAAAAV